MQSLMSTYTLEVLDKHNREPSSLISILNEIQEEYHYIPRDIIEILADELKVSRAKIFGVITFYAQFKLVKPGKYMIKVCNGTACFVGGSGMIKNSLKFEFNILTDQTTEDGLFSMEEVSCIGACALAPVLDINGEVHGKMNTKKLKRAVKDIKRREV